VRHLLILPNWEKGEIWMVCIEEYTANRKYPFLSIFNLKGHIMDLKSFFPLTLALLLLLFSGGCSKKVIKVESNAEVSAPEAEQEIKPPAADGSFRELDMDARMRDVLLPIYFDYDRYTILNSESQKLERIASFLKDNDFIRVLIEGHCDERGSSEYNIGLGESRARAVRQWLMAYGIQDPRLEITSFGKERPAVTGCENDQCHAKNRRDEWKVFAK
jgi:peptidoglycan-associated lipoprotein